MRTPKQTQASRTNGAKSKGPVTPKGKRNSSRNSIRHGLLAETVVLEDEHNGRFLALLNDLLDEHQPATPTQTLLVETLAAAVWRQKRIWGMQKVAFDEDVASVDSAPESPALRAVLALRASPECVRSHELMLRYEVALDRQISRSLLRLQQLQERQAQKVSKVPEQVLVPAEESTPAKRTQQPIETVTPADPQTAVSKPVLPKAATQPPSVNVDRETLRPTPRSNPQPESALRITAARNTELQNRKL
jgi:hypothetical protein